MNAAGWIVAGYAAVVSSASLAWQVWSWHLARKNRVKVVSWTRFARVFRRGAGARRFHDRDLLGQGWVRVGREQLRRGALAELTWLIFKQKN